MADPAAPTPSDGQTPTPGGAPLRGASQGLDYIFSENFMRRGSSQMNFVPEYEVAEKRVERFGDEGGCNGLFGDWMASPEQSRAPAVKFDAKNPQWRWKDGKLNLACARPIVHVPLVQEVHRRDKIIEVPQLEVIDAVQPKVFRQGVQHEVPKFKFEIKAKTVEMPVVKYVSREVIVPIVTGYTHKFVPKWEIREVPRPVVKYIGEQKIIEVDVPQVKFVDKVIEKEIIVDTIEKRVPKIIEEIRYVDTVKYVWKAVDKPVYVEKYVPKFDVSLECPAPLIVPYTVKTVKDVPAIMMRKRINIPPPTDIDMESPEGMVRVPEVYIQDNLMRPKKEGFCLNACDADADSIMGDDEGYSPLPHNNVRAGYETNRADTPPHQLLKDIEDETPTEFLDPENQA